MEAVVGRELDEEVVEGAVYLQGTPRVVHLSQAFWGPVHLTFAARHDSQAVIGRRTTGLAPSAPGHCQFWMKLWGMFSLRDLRRCWGVILSSWNGQQQNQKWEERVKFSQRSLAGTFSILNIGQKTLLSRKEFCSSRGDPPRLQPYERTRGTAAATPAAVGLAVRVSSWLSDDVIHQQMPFSLLLRQGSLAYNAPCQHVQIGAMWSTPALAPAWTKERPQLKWPELRLAYK